MITAAPDLSGHRFDGKRHWQARLDLTFSERAGRSVLSSLDFYGPLRVQNLFYPEKAGPSGILPCHCYLLHPPGGLVSGDALSFRVNAGANTQLLPPPPTAGKF